jgi:hypothetical protein
VVTVTALPGRTPAHPARVASMEERRALASIAAQLQEAWERGEERGEELGWARGYAECARQFGLPPAVAGRPRHLSAVPAGGAS